jgi:EAL domain-containing protein (putative c-di-GMP-specific phosphodiesterase class I)/FixJ family two-component response regulator
MNINQIAAELKRRIGADAHAPAVSQEQQKHAFSQLNKPLCFVVEDEPEIGRLIATVLKTMGIEVEEFRNVHSLMNGLNRRHPQHIFLDISLEKSDAIEAIYGLSKLQYLGTVNLMSGQHSQLLADVRQIGERQNLRMLTNLLKPFAVATVRKIVQESFGSVQKEATDYPTQEKVPHIGINEALAKGWMKMWYQPKIDLKKKLLVGCEALARIEHPEYGVIYPGAFLPDADPQSMTRLTEFALLTVLRASTDFYNAGISLRPAVNVPVDVLLNFPLAALVRENRPKNDAWKGLIVEVTEDQIVEDIERAKDVATQLKIYDILLSIDDFGAGYSSIARLKHFPFAELKLDMSFVKNCAKNSQNAAICKTVIDLAHSFEAQAVAEGIEYSDDLRALYHMGCDLGQGYLLATPMPLDRFISTLARRKAPQPVQDLNKIA